MAEKDKKKEESEAQEKPKPVIKKEAVDAVLKKAQAKAGEGSISASKTLFKRLAATLVHGGQEQEAQRILNYAGDFFKQSNYWDASNDMYELAGNQKGIAELWDYVASRKGEIKVGNREYQITEADTKQAYQLAGDAYTQLGDQKKAQDRYARAGEKIGDLEKFAEAASVVMLLSGLFFLSNNLTGNVILSTPGNVSNILGIALLVFGLLIGFFSIKSRKR